jgi:predicted nucleic acid-binding protein
MRRPGALRSLVEVSPVSRRRPAVVSLRQETETVVLVDTSVWIDHLDAGDNQISHLLQSDALLMHPAIIGEIALGNLKNRRGILSSLHRLMSVVIAKDAEVLALIESKTLAGSGIGYTDAHLVAATLLTPQCTLWTRDKRLDAVARRMGIAYQPLH